MCGRSRQTVEPQALAAAVGFSGNVPLRRASHYRRRENAHPGNAAPIAYRTSTGGSALRTMRWGLIPSFTKRSDKPDFFRMFNARSETAADKPSFRRLVGRRHGVVAFSGFYEWKQDDKGERQPYYFHYSDNRPLLFAVLYDTWQQGDRFDGGGGGKGRATAAATASATDSNSKPATPGGEAKEERGRGQEQGHKKWEEEKERREGGEADMQMELLKREVEEEDRGESLLFSYAVLTTSAAPRLAWLHDRMPVILNGAQEAAAWLSCKGGEASTFLKNHRPYGGDDLVWHPVSKQMNTMWYDGDDCSAAIELKKPSKPLPAITSFFKRMDQAVGNTGSSAGGGGDHDGGRDIRETEGRTDADKVGDGAWIGGGGEDSHSSSSISPAKRLRTVGEDRRGRGGGLEATRSGDTSSSTPPPSMGSSLTHASSPRSAHGSHSDGRGKARKAGSPSPSKKGGPRAGGGAGAAAAAAANRDRKQSKLTSFFQRPC